MKYLVLIHQTVTGYSVDVPDLPGCVATGRTVEHARKMIAEAIQMHLELIRRSGDSVPVPSQNIQFAVDHEAGEELCTWVIVEAETGVEA